MIFFYYEFFPALSLVKKGQRPVHFRGLKIYLHSFRVGVKETIFTSAIFKIIFFDPPVESV